MYQESVPALSPATTTCAAFMDAMKWIRVEMAAPVSWY